jgi:hypothetical protein
VPRIGAIVGVQGWRWDWVREVHALVFALDADTVRQQWRELARAAALRGKQVAVLPAAAYGSYSDGNETWVARTLAVDTWCTPGEETGARRVISADLSEAWEKRDAIMLVDGHHLPADAARLAWKAPGVPAVIKGLHAGHDGGHP